MNDDPTRIMSNGDGDPGRDDGPHYSPEDKQRHLRYLLIGLASGDHRPGNRDPGHFRR